jgi:hypothetical protein
MSAEEARTALMSRPIKAEHPETGVSMTPDLGPLQPLSVRPDA